MIVERIWTNNRLRNFNYLIVCPETGEALAIDPSDSAKTLASAKDHGWEITQVLNTHEHYDHIEGNDAIIAATGAKLIAHKNAGKFIPGIDRGVGSGDIIKVGKTVELECLDTPGHTMCHICLHAHADEPALFSGDTLFNAGCGHVKSGGNIEALYTTFTEQLAKLPGNTRVYPGHDYIENNLKFTLNCESDNVAAAALLPEVTGHDPNHSIVTTLEEERKINTFLRLDSPSILAKLRQRYPNLGDAPDRSDVFAKLRELRNSW